MKNDSVIKLKNLLIKAFSRLKNSFYRNELPSVDVIYNDVYLETLNELTIEYNSAHKSFEQAKEIHAKIKSNEALTPDEAKKLGVIQIN